MMISLSAVRRMFCALPAKPQNRMYVVTRKNTDFVLRIERFFVHRTKKRSIRKIFDP